MTNSWRVGTPTTKTWYNPALIFTEGTRKKKKTTAARLFKLFQEKFHCDNIRQLLQRRRQLHTIHYRNYLQQRTRSTSGYIGTMSTEVTLPLTTTSSTNQLHGGCTAQLAELRLELDRRSNELGKLTLSLRACDERLARAPRWWWWVRREHERRTRAAASAAAHVESLQRHISAHTEAVTKTKLKGNSDKKKTKDKGEIIQGSCCPICLEGIRKHDAFVLPCGHLFNQRCIIDWLQIKQVCPVCKIDIVIEV